MLDIAVSDDNARFASVGGDRQVFLWDVGSARTVRRWGGHGGRVNAVGFGGEGGEGLWLVVSERVWWRGGRVFGRGEKGGGRLICV